MSAQGSGYAGQTYASEHRQHHHPTSGMTSRLTHRDYPQTYPSVSLGTSTASAPVISSSYRSVSGLYETDSPLCAAPASSTLLDAAFHHHPQTAWTPPPFRSSPSTSSQSPPDDVTPHYDYLGAGGADYVALSAMLSSTGTETVQIIPGRGRVVKRRVSANRKERRRTHSINSAFSALRGCIPNVPSDTKLSKIKTLRLATSYIAYLMDILGKDDPVAQRQLHEAGFKADISRKIESREERRRRETEVCQLHCFMYTHPGGVACQTKFGERSFSHAGPTSWNSLPADTFNF